jgi:hypothetical protein
MKKREKKTKERREWGVNEYFLTLKFARQWSLALLIEVHLSKGTALASETGKVLGCGHFDEECI